MAVDYVILSRKPGAKTWRRHLPGYQSEATAQKRMVEFRENCKDREYMIREYPRSTVRWHPNGQRVR